MKPLSEMLCGEFAYIVDFEDKNVTIQLFDAGCFPGDLIRMVENHPAHSFLSFRYRHHVIHIDRAKAKTVITNPISYSFCLN